MNNKSIFVGLTLAAVAAILLGSYNAFTNAQVLEKDSPPLNASSLEDVDISISPDEALPINGTVIMNTEGITDYDINDLVPLGVSVIIQNDSVTVTNGEVDVAEGGIALEQAAESNDDGNSDEE